jgi:tetratricopeptide (TPR) repeat protein/CHAT domain-containing protein
MVLLVALLAAGTPAAALPPPVPLGLEERLRERDRLRGESVQLWNAGKRAEAVAALNKQIAIERAVVGANHPDVFKSQQLLDRLLETMADDHDRRRQVDAARKARLEVLALRRTLYRDQDWRVTDARLALADCERLAGFDAARRARYWQSFVLADAAAHWREEGRFAEALGLAQRVVLLHADLLGKDHRAYAQSLNNLAGLYEAAGDYPKALPLYEQARAINKKVLGQDHPEYATSLDNLAVLYRTMGDYGKARPLHEEARTIYRNTVGVGHPDYAACLNNLAGLFHNMGDYVKALPLYEEARAVREKALGVAHPDYAQSLNNLALLYEAMGAYSKALPLLQEARAINRRALGASHPTYALSLTNLAALYQAMGDYPRALPLYEEACTIQEKALGQGHPDHAQSLNNLAQLYRSMGKYPKALPLSQQACAIYRKALGATHPRYATSVSNLALLHQDMGDYQSALPLYEQARAIQEKVLGTDHPDYALSLNNLALLYRATGDYSKALTLLQEARAIYRRALRGTHPTYALILNNLGELYYCGGDFQKALPLCEEAHAIKVKALGTNHPDYALSLNSLGELYSQMGEYRKALVLLKEASAITKKALGSTHPRYATSLGNLALLHEHMGDYQSALPLYEQARAIREKALGTDHPDYARSLNSLANLYQAKGDYSRALTLYEAACAIDNKAVGTDHPNYAQSLSGLAALYVGTGDYEQALPLLEKVRAINRKALGTAHPNYATTLNNLAALYQAVELFQKALPLYEEARAIKKKAWGTDHPGYARSLNNLGRLYHDMAAYQKALPLYDEARAIREKVLGTGHLDYAESLTNLGALYQDLGDYQKALLFYEEARAIEEKVLGHGHPASVHNLNELAGLYQAMGQVRTAGCLLQESWAITRTFLDRAFTAQSSRQRLRFLVEKRVTLDAYLSVAPDAGLEPSRNDVNAYVTIVLQNQPFAAAACSRYLGIAFRATSLYEAVLAWKGGLAARQAEEHAARSRSDLLPTLDELRQARAGLARLYQQQPANPGQRADWLKRFREFEARKEQLEVELAGASETYRRFRGLLALTADQVSAALPPGTTLIDFVQYTHFTPPPKGEGRFQREQRLLAFVLTRGRPPVCVWLGPADTIDQAVQTWRRAMLDPNMDPHPASAAVARHLWARLAPAVEGATMVLIAPDGVVCGLPFAALPGTKPATFLLEERAIGYVTSGRHLLELEADSDRPSTAGLLAVGGLTYGNPQAIATPAPLPDYLKRGRQWAPLPGTRLEVERVASRFRSARPDKDQVRLLTGAEGDADRLRRELQPIAERPRWRYLHLATHGFFDPPLPAEDPARRPKNEGPTFGKWREHLTFGRNPLLRAGLVLAGANRDPDRGFLTAEEVADLDLAGCELAVLSACETSLGKVADGEGMLGLQRAFQAAGARTLVTSLWSVNDAATSVLMEEFYTNLWQKKMTKLEALRQAQLTVLRDPEKVEARARELSKELAQRGGGKLAGDLPNEGRVAPGQPRRSPPAWWAAFILSGDIQ